MRIGIDASSILTSRSGIRNYTLNLLKQLVRLDTENEYVIFINSFRKSHPNLPFLISSRVRLKRYHIADSALLLVWQYLRFPPVELFTGRIDLFHSPEGIIPPQIKGKRVVTVHDLYFMEHPEETDDSRNRFLHRSLRSNLLKADKIIASSHSTKAEIIKHFNINPARITVIYLGVDLTRFCRLTAITRDTQLLELIRQEYCLPPQYILTVSTIEPRKNIEGLLFAYRRLKQILNNPPKLVIVGRWGCKSDRIKEVVQQLELIQDVIFTDYIPDEHLPLIYNNALLFVFPSLAEGFGLPLLEAMACGLPVIASNAPALKEIAEEVAIIVDPHNYYLLADKMKEVILSHKLRTQLSEKSLQQARNFNWENCARKTLKVYKEVVTQKTGNSPQ